MVSLGEEPTYLVVLRDLALILVVGKALEELFHMLGYPPVLGDILAGIILGPTLLGLVSVTEVTEAIAWFGIVILLFLAGLETKFAEFKHHFGSMITVALGGVLGALLSGYLVGMILGYSFVTSLFLGALLAATSISLTVKTLMELDRLRTDEGVTVLGAAVFDDVLGLLLLAIATQVAVRPSVDVLEITLATGAALTFWFLVVFLGHKISHHLYRAINKFRLEDARYIVLLALMLLIAYSSHHVGLAPIVGAYAFGLALSEIPGVTKIVGRLSILANTFATIFFVSTTAALDLKQVLHYEHLFTILLIVLAGLLSKIVGCGIAALLTGFPLYKALIIGVAMLPRAEVCLIIASLGLTHEVLGVEHYFSAILLIYITSLLTPPLLKALYSPLGQRLARALENLYRSLLQHLTKTYLHHLPLLSGS